MNSFLLIFRLMLAQFVRAQYRNCQSFSELRTVFFWVPCRMCEAAVTSPQPQNSKRISDSYVKLRNVESFPCIEIKSITGKVLCTPFEKRFPCVIVEGVDTLLSQLGAVQEDLNVGSKSPLVELDMVVTQNLLSLYTFVWPMETSCS